MGAEPLATWLWPLWAVSWWLAARWSDKATARPGARAEAAYRLLNVVGFALIFLFIAQPTAELASGRAVKIFGALRGGAFGSGLWTTPAALGWTLVGVEAAGFGVCWWARLHLGRLWSGWVTRKAEHRVVETGPYRFVRHPIYTGLLLAALATTAIKGSPAALIGFAVLAWSFHLKARLEERFLRSQLGAAAYDAYAARTPMLVPAIWRGR